MKENDVQTEETTIIQTDVDSSDGQTKCPKCGSTDISTNVKKGKLRCNFCRHEFEPEKVVGIEKDVSKLKGKKLASGAKNISADAKNMITLKCESCAAEVVIDTSEVTQARCHWCRNTLSINKQIPNGSVPDVVLPFCVTKMDAQKKIEEFVGKRKFYAHPKFRSEFTTENIMGVYFPYMIVDVNAHASLSGKGEHLVRRYTLGSGQNRRTYYDADLYSVKRDFDIEINGLTVESSKDKLDKDSKEKTTNIINAIMPFDTENCVKWDANYLKGYSSERRDVNVDSLSPIVCEQSKDIARFSANDSLKHYDRGVCWEEQNLDVKGEQWQASYLPVWLYSYQHVSGDKKVLHYVAVNARTKETMGSVPIHIPKLLLISALVEIIGIIFMIFADFDERWIFLSLGFIYYAIIYLKYRNSNARHNHEVETKNVVKNMKENDEFIEKRTRLLNSRMTGANNTSVAGDKTGLPFLDNLGQDNKVVSLVTSFSKDNNAKSEKKEDEK